MFAKWLVAGIGILGMAGCAGSRTQVKDEWLARVPREELGAVRDAQEEVRRAREEVTRAEVAVRDAQRDQEVSAQEANAARAMRAAGEANLENARAKGRAPAINDARRELARIDARLDDAQAEVEVRKEAVDVARARVALREELVERALARQSLAEYQALRDSGDVRARQISEKEFQEQVSEANRAVARAQRNLTDARREFERARASLNRNSGYGGSGDSQDR